MLPLNEKTRMRVLTAVSKRGLAYFFRHTLVITISLAILVAVPLLGIVRLDLWQGNHLLLGKHVSLITGIKGFVIAMAIMYGGTFISNVIVGRFFCGWGCPVGYVSRLGETVDRNKSGWHWWLSHLFGAAFVGVFVGSIMLWWVDWRVMLDGSLTAKLVVGGIFVGLSVGGLLHAFIWRFLFCTHACPIGIYYRYVTSSAPIGIVFSQIPSPCVECGACEKICPVDLDPKALGQAIETEDGDERYGDAECIRCGDCVAACTMIYKTRPGETAPLRFGRVSAAADDSATEAESSPPVEASSASLPGQPRSPKAEPPKAAGVVERAEADAACE